MAVPKRHAKPPGTFFVTSRTWESRPLFRKEKACELFVETLLRYRLEQACKLHGFVLMPDHFHLLLTPSDKTTLERVVQYIKGGSAHRIGEELDFRLPVWQRGFSDHPIRDAGDYETHVRYIAQNPVNERLASTPDEYAWSSASGRFELDEPPQRLKPRGMPTRIGTAEAVP